MKYALLICLLAGCTLAYNPANWVPVREGDLEYLQKDLGNFLDKLSSVRERSYSLEKINSATVNSENPMEFVVNADLIIANVFSPSCSLYILYDGPSEKIIKVISKDL